MYTSNHNEEDRLAAIEAAREWTSMDFVILDTETTGLGSLACIDRDSNVLVDSLVNPGVAIPAEAAAIHGITDADVSDKLCFTDLCPLVWDVVRLADCVLIYNAAFDSRLIRQSLQGDEGALNQAAQLRCGCIMELYANFYGQYSEYHGSYTWQKLVNAVRQCGLEMAGSAHRGLADARASLAVLKYVAAMSNGG